MRGKASIPIFFRPIEEGQALAIPLLTRATIQLNGHEGGIRRCTAKQAAFAAAWAQTDSVSMAYAIAYKSKMRGEALRANGNKVAAKPQVLTAYKRTLDTTARRIAESRHGVTIDRIMRELAHIGFSNLMDYFKIDPDGRVFLVLGKATRDHMAAVQILEGDVLMVPAEDVLAAARIQAKKGQLLKVPVRRFRLKLHNKHKSLAAMGKHLGMF
jgi:phage terminase small subunit